MPNADDTLIEIDPRILHGKPFIKGTRIKVDTILEKIENGETFDQILKLNARLNLKTIYACIAFGEANK